VIKKKSSSALEFLERGCRQKPGARCIAMIVLHSIVDTQQKVFRE
jgi:hypothetical protein